MTTACEAGPGETDLTDEAAAVVEGFAARWLHEQGTCIQARAWCHGRLRLQPIGCWLLALYGLCDVWWGWRMAGTCIQARAYILGQGICRQGKR